MEDNLAREEAIAEWVAKFWEYHTAHSDVYGYFDRFATEVIEAGHSTYGAGAVIERIRWEYDLAAGTDTEAFKIDSRFNAFYARLWMREHPEFAKTEDRPGFFTTRYSRLAYGMFNHPSTPIEYRVEEEEATTEEDAPAELLW